ncbi:MAG: Cytosol aminopeptidase [Alphaproteobacteria bacterium MarineAlpha3_Bin2]|jgi:leucyl aminopeptidase|nr:MAG: Cytosol aminopeptidase [Alphaproteobacteria bacterium MarineAlpha3_Bin1]PPR73894.1 MAG: Cytosol aminopeptidase [Alphaproteobacteria bacterium MarineAlpha3_Bin2]
MKIVFSGPGSAATGALVVGVLDGNTLTPSAKALNKKINRGLSRAIKASRFQGKTGQSLAVVTPAGTRLDRLLIVGLGKAKDVNEQSLCKLGGRIYASLAASGSKAATILVDPLEGSTLNPARMAAAIAEGAQLRSYRFGKYHTKSENDSKPTLTTLTLRCRGSAKAKAEFRARDKIVQGVFMTRDLVTEPPNVIYPDSLAKRCKELTKLGVKVEVLGEPQMRRLGMGALLGVGQGSIRESRLVVMRWNGKRGAKAKKDKPVCFVGKGITFDTGGISLKPSGGMEEMKYDMGGSGVVIGLMKALAGRKAKVNAVGVIALAENMPGSNAQRPSDVVTSMSGQTIEVLNTDAEGRLVLADALHYANTRFKPQFIVDLATLTGAIIVALGSEYAGLFSNNDKLSERLSDAGEEVGELVWRLPQGEVFDKMLKSDIADMKNISGGRGAGSITAAQFLGRFVGKTPWAHLDIAGVTWTKSDKPLSPKGATAFGVRLLNRLVADYYEAK